MKPAYNGHDDFPLHLIAAPKILLIPSGMNVHPMIPKYALPSFMTRTSSVNILINCKENTAERKKNAIPVSIITRKFTQILLSSDSLSFFPIYWDIMIPAIVQIAPTTNE